MCQTLLLTGFILLDTSIPAMFARADESLSEDETKRPAVSVRCHGLLRHGVVAIGGETTGTTITFQRVTWELKFKDNDDREFSARHHKQQVLVTGALRKVVGTENLIRWIIDVERISTADLRDAGSESVQISVRGTLRAALSATGDIPILSVRTEEHAWRLDFSESRDIQAESELLIGQPVLLTGTLLPLPDDAERKEPKSRIPETPSIRVKTISTPPSAATDSRSVE